MKKYKFIGAGLGVPGLPHEVTDVQAEGMGLGALLAECVQAGLYEEIKEKAVAVEPRASDKRRTTEDERKKKESDE